MPASMQVTFYADRVMQKSDKKMRTAMAAVGTRYANTVKKLMRDSPASGRRYGGHRASAPGEAPAPDTGRLVTSITWRLRFDAGWWVVEVGTPVKYALFLEYGAARGITVRSGKNKGRLKAMQWVLFPRPAWGPAMAIVRPQIPGIIKRGK